MYPSHPSRRSTSPFSPPPVFTLPPLPPFSSQFARTSHKLLTLTFHQPPTFHYHPISASSSPFRVVQVRGDGRCLYRAIAKGLANNEGRRLSESLERADADALREMAFRAVCVDRFNEFAAKQVVEGSLKHYCRRMRVPTFYAGEAEMLALADVLKVPIRVYLISRGELRNIITYGEKYGKRMKTGKGSDVCVLYSNGNHYDALLQT